MKCKCCKNDRFIGHQVIRADVEVDGNGEFAGNLFGRLESHIYASQKPYGPFTCTKCGAEYGELSEAAVPTNMRLKEGVWILNDSKTPVTISGVVKAKYTEIWEGTVVITSPCLVDLKTREIVSIDYAGDITIDTGECESDVIQRVIINDQEYDVIDEGEFRADYAEDWDPDASDSCNIFWMKS